MKFLSWNVNGLRAAVKKGFDEVLAQSGADFFCIQETKLQEGQQPIDFPDYFEYWNHAHRKGYSGTAIFAREEPLGVDYDLGCDDLDGEGRVITLETPDLFLVNVYTPNAQDQLARIDFRLAWDQAFRLHVQSLAKKKGVVICGDLNVAHQPIDLTHPGPNKGHAGFSDEERGSFGQLLEAGFVDSFRHLNPDLVGAYSWWSYRFNARANNTGWRIDYFVVSQNLVPHISGAFILPEIMGSDHCPVGLVLSGVK